VAVFRSQEGFRSRVAQVLSEPEKLSMGSETGNQAYERFASAIDIVLGQQDGNLAVVTHGTVMSLFVARAAGIDPVRFWQRLGLPAFVVLSVPGFGLVDIVDHLPQ
jgi:broad specificity phosphatase PhoE